MSEREDERKDMEREANPDGNRVETLSKMINASRAFRNLPPEMTMGKEYDVKRGAKKKGQGKFSIE